MKKRISRNFIFIFIACVILCALLGVVLSSTGTFVAAAKDVPEFAIATQDNNLWTLKKGGVQIAQYTGVFFEYQNTRYFSKTPNNTNIMWFPRWDSRIEK